MIMNEFLRVNDRKGRKPFQSTSFNTQFNWGASLFEDHRHWISSAGGSPLVRDSKGQDPSHLLVKL
jgi:hypothetical protein